MGRQKLTQKMGPDSHHEETYHPIRPYVGYRDENAFFAVLRDNIYDLCVLPLLFLQPVTPSPLLWLENFLPSFSVGSSEERNNRGLEFYWGIQHSINLSYLQKIIGVLSLSHSPHIILFVHILSDPNRYWTHMSEVRTLPPHVFFQSCITGSPTKFLLSTLACLIKIISSHQLSGSFPSFGLTLLYYIRITGQLIHFPFHPQRFSATRLRLFVSF